jgi:hypothetical protein
VGHRGPNEDTSEWLRRLDTQQPQLVCAQTQFGEASSHPETARIIKFESLVKRT